MVSRRLTHKYQPLDLKKFGSVKAQQREFMNEKILSTLLNAFDKVKGEFIGVIPIAKGLTKKEV